jgi:Tol biopolymer transport system component
MSLLTRPNVAIFVLIGLVAALALVVLSSGGDKGAQAAYPPGVDGKITFYRSGGGVYDIWVMDADGSNQTNLTADQAEDAYYPRWSPDGTKIAYEVDVYDDGSDADIWVMNADGSGKVGIAQAETYEGGPTWSPDGMKITFHDGDDVWVMNADGSNRMNLTNDPAFDCCAEWSPDGSRIQFDSQRSGDRLQWVMAPDGSSPSVAPGSIDGDSGYRFSPDGQKYVFYGPGDIYTMKVDGTNRQQITDNDQWEHSPTWSADGTRIIFTREVAENVGQIFSMNPDGSDPVNLSNSAGYDSNPDVQVLPATTGLIWGDGDCGGAVNLGDAIGIARHLVSLPVNQEDGCPGLGSDITFDGTSRVWQDIDCSGSVSLGDAIGIARFLVSLPVNKPEECPDIGTVASG